MVPLIRRRTGAYGGRSGPAGEDLETYLPQICRIRDEASSSWNPPAALTCDFRLLTPVI
jgi:hypothetical protein